MRKIGLFLSAEPHGGGKFQYSLSILEATASLPRDKFFVVVAYSSRVWELYLNRFGFDKIYVPNGVWRWFFDRIWRNIQLPISLWRKISLYLTSYAKLLVNQNCDLWIFPSEDTLAYQIPVPSLVTIFDLMHRYEPHFPEVAAYGRARRRDRHYKNICRWAKGILVDSEIGKQHVIESYSIKREKVHILPYIPPYYIYSSKSVGDFNSRWNLPPKFLFYPAQFWEHKNHKGLINAIRILKPELPDLKLVLVGSKKNAYKSVLKLVKDSNLVNDIIFLDFVPNEDMPEFYRHARALIMPTFFGPTNIPPLEAFALGCPVAVSKIYAMPEQLGDAALYFNPSSEEEIATAIRRLWCDDELCHSLISKGFAKAKEYGRDQFNQRFKEIIFQVLKG